MKDKRLFSASDLNDIGPLECKDAVVTVQHGFPKLLRKVLTNTPVVYGDKQDHNDVTRCGSNLLTLKHFTINFKLIFT